MFRQQGLASASWLLFCARADAQYTCAVAAGFASKAAPSSRTPSSAELEELGKIIYERGREFQQPPDMVEMYDLNTKQLTFGHLPATASLMEGLTLEKSSEEPLQDPAGWAERHHPNFMARPHGPFYNWVKWMQVHLPQEEQDMYLKLDHVMGRDTSRSAFLKTAQWELSRLWNWQHHRVAANLPPDIPAHERVAASVVPLQEAGVLVDAEASLDERSLATALPSDNPQPSASESDATPSSLSQMFTKFRPVPPPKVEEVDPLLQRIQSMPSWDVRRLTRVLQDKKSLGTTARKLQKRRKIASSRTFESDLQEAAGSHYLGQELEAAEDAQLRPLTVREYTSQVQAGRPWHKTALLDRTHLLQAAYQDYAAAALQREALKLRPFALKDDGWQFDLFSRPPTRNLDLLCDYLELKYADAVLMKDFVFLNKQEMSGRSPVQVMQNFVDEQWERGPFVDAVKAEQAKHIPLSPQEVQAINTHATELLHSDPQAYKQLMSQLKADGLITEEEFVQVMKVADVKAYEMVVEAEQKLLDDQPVGDDDRDMLLKLLQRGKGNGHGKDWKPDVAEHVWGNVTAESAKHADAMKKGAEQYLQKLVTKGVPIPEEQFQDLLEWWDTPLSFQEASRLWKSYADSAGIPVSPSLEAVLATAKPLASTSLSPADASHAPSTAAATENASSSSHPTEPASTSSASDGNLPLADPTHISHDATSSSSAELAPATGSAESGATTTSTPPTQSTTSSPPMLLEVPSATYSPAAAASLDERLRHMFEAYCEREGVDTLTWEQALAANAAASAENQDSLLGLFPEVLTIDQMVKQHLDKCALQVTGEDAEGNPGTDPKSSREREDANLFPALHRWWQTTIKRRIATSRRERQLLGAQQAVHSDSDSDSDSDSEVDSSSSSSDSDSDNEAGAINTGSVSADKDGVGTVGGLQAAGVQEAANASEAWERYIRQQAQVRAVAPDPLANETFTAPPYPGAARLLSVEQTLMLHAGAGMFEHPLGRKVRVRVHVGELQKELGMSEQATQLMIQVAGPQYDPETGEVGVSCRRHARREENLRWCIETIHKLVDECNKVHPSQDFRRLWRSTA